MLRKSYRSRCANPRPTWDNLIPAQHTYVEAMPARMVMGEPRLLPQPVHNLVTLPAPAVEHSQRPR
jgi:hypothetical protein